MFFHNKAPEVLEDFDLDNTSFATSSDSEVGLLQGAANQYLTNPDRSKVNFPGICILRGSCLVH